MTASTLPRDLEPILRRFGVDPDEADFRHLCWTDDRSPEWVFFRLFSAHGFDVEASPLTLEGKEGLILADALGDLWLSGRALADGTAAADLVRKVGVLVVEGAVPFLQAATERSDADESAPCVLGVPGLLSWTQEIADRIPDGTRVALALSARVEHRVLATLAGRLRAGRLEVIRVAEQSRGAA